ncbi:hypothetical protein [Microvirga aerophila]|nr:hypothetical protein [Microvirga aerophila]
MKLRIIPVLSTLIVLSATSAANAFFCSKPDAPRCATGYGSFDDRWEFDRCKTDMERFKDEVEEHLTCLKWLSSKAVSDYNEAIESFNRRARS